MLQLKITYLQFLISRVRGKETFYHFVKQTRIFKELESFKLKIVEKSFHSTNKPPQKIAEAEDLASLKGLQHVYI